MLAIPQMQKHLLHFFRRLLMKIKVEEPSIPKDIQQKTRNLQVLLEQADSLRDEILVLSGKDRRVISTTLFY